MDACKISPANLDVVITVGASEVDNKFNPGQQEHDILYTWSNTGTCVDLFAPGMLAPQPLALCMKCQSIGTCTYNQCPDAGPC